jgi:hypothetical protein
MNAHASAFDDATSSTSPLVVEVDIGQPPRGGFPHRVIPAIAGGLFAGLLLVGLGCTPLFSGQKSHKFAAETGQVVHAGSQTIKKTSPAVDSAVQTPAATSAAAPEKAGTPATSMSAAATGMVTPAATSAARGPEAVKSPAGSHSFRIQCGDEHAKADSTAPRPETVSLQGIMAGRNSRTALLNGVLYREGDVFGAAACPWTIAMIEPARVRLEKAFGDRVCGVTIALQDSSAQAKAH